MSNLDVEHSNYLTTFIKMFAYRSQLSEEEAFNYLDAHKGIAFLEKHYDAVHMLDFEDVISDVQDVCRNNGGML